MNKLDALAGQKKPLLACYLPFADPLVPDDLEAVYADCGVDIIEVGLPCDNPWADGATVAASMRRAHAENPGLDALVEKLAQLRHRMPLQGLVLMGYGESMDAAALLEKAGPLIDGVLSLGGYLNTADVCPADAGEVHEITCLPHVLRPAELDRVSSAKGYVMLQAVDGVTGVRDEIPDNSRQIADIRAAGAKVPVLLGFGISKVEHIGKVMAMGADGVVIGSACINLAEKKDWTGLENFLKRVRTELDEFRR